MSQKICPNCRKINEEKDGIKCIYCGSDLDIDKFIQSKTLKKGLLSKIKSKFITTKKDKTNAEIKEFILLNQEYNNYKSDLIELKSKKINEKEAETFKDKYTKHITKLESFEYLEEIKKDEDLNKNLNELNSIQKFFKNYDKEIKEANKTQKKIESYLEKITEFNNYFNELLNNKQKISNNTKDEIILKNKIVYEFFDRKEIEELNLSKDSKEKINKFKKEFKNIDKTINEINDKINLKILEDKINSYDKNAKEFNNELNGLLNSEFYITFKQKEDLKEEYEFLYNLIKRNQNKNISLKTELKTFLNNYDTIDSTIKSRNEKYVNNELIKHNDLFDNINGLSLDKNQRLAVVTNDLSEQIIAGAGCGKTLTVTGKVKYLIERKGIKPSEILCISYSNASVNDLKKKLPNGIKTKTFHSLGRSILRENNKPSIPQEDILEDFIKIYFRDNVINNKKLCDKILKFYAYYLYKHINEDKLSSLGELYDMEEGRDFKTLRQLYGAEKDKITLDNIKVKSLEELVIANFFFMHQINYTYEKTYTCKNKDYDNQKKFISYLLYEDIEVDKVPITDSNIITELGQKIMNYFNIKRKETLNDYHPDFYLEDYEIYLEHFGVNRNCDARWLNQKESQKYKDGIKWKRNLHKEKGTKLLETYSYYMSENRLLSRLEEKLIAENVTVKEIDYEYLFKKINERDDVKKYNDFINLIQRFIELFKGNNHTLEDFNKFREINEKTAFKFNKERNKLFIDIVEDIYIGYENHLRKNKKIDFNDMINNATALIKEGKTRKKYKYIIVDEYQDTSHTRYQLLKALQDHLTAKICVVGDDWQSIYRFSGCDVGLFNKFENYFENPIKLKIETTYRNSQELIDISGDFIKKNPNQINKSLKSNKESKEKPVKIAYYNTRDRKEKIKILEYVVNKISENSKNILILGRHKFDIDKYLKSKYNPKSPFAKLKNNSKIDYQHNPQLNIKYSTVHASKGLEEDNVIIINLENKTLGFPNQKIDDSILDFVINDSDQYKFGEERRLFYVALTRTKNNVYLLTPEDNKSQFVKELEENKELLEIIPKEKMLGESLSKENVEEFMKNKRIYSIPTELKCPICKTGELTLVLLNKGTKRLIKFFACSHDRCKFDSSFYSSDFEFIDEIEICPKCNKGIIQVFEGQNGPYGKCNNQKCGKTHKFSAEKLERINKIIQKKEDKIKFKTIKTELKCPKCNKGTITLAINPKNKNKIFKCSNSSCNWRTNKIRINNKDLKYVKLCDNDCEGLLIPQKSHNGNKVLKCTNFNKGCRNTCNINDNEPQDKFYQEQAKENLLCNLENLDISKEENIFLSETSRISNAQYKEVKKALETNKIISNSQNYKDKENLKNLISKELSILKDPDVILDKENLKNLANLFKNCPNFKDDRDFSVNSPEDLVNDYPYDEVNEKYKLIEKGKELEKNNTDEEGFLKVKEFYESLIDNYYFKIDYYPYRRLGIINLKSIVKIFLISTTSLIRIYIVLCIKLYGLKIKF